MESINPATGELVKTYEEMTTDDVGGVIDASRSAFEGWRATALEERSKLMLRAADALHEHSESLARTMTQEMGKVMVESRAEVEKCAWVCRYYAENAAKFLADRHVATDAARSYVAFQPLGVILAVMPWNFPFWQVFRFAAPALMAGNTGLLKHASNVTGCAIAIEKLLASAGFPEDVFRTLVIPSPRVEEVIRSPHVAAVTVTGSTEAGSAVAGAAGRLIKKSVLELGGSDPYVILADADLDLAAETCATSRLINAGQSCIAAKRFIVVDSVRDAFEERFVDCMSKRKMGDPLREDVDLGPQARLELRDQLHLQVTRSVRLGARLMAGGEVPDGPGAFYPPTVLTDVAPGMPAFDEEVFGPVAALVPVDDEGAAIRAANDSSFGLGAAVFSRDVERAEHIARNQLEAGCCFVNSFVRSDPRLPFGGIKGSGYGRELSDMGIREFANAKTVYIA